LFAILVLFNIIYYQYTKLSYMRHISTMQADFVLWIANFYTYDMFLRI